MVTTKMLKPSALSYYDMRRLDSLPPHFETASLPYRYNLETPIREWIEDKLKGRYYLSRKTDLNENNEGVIMLCVGFEEKRELSYFLLACPYLKYK